MSAPLPNEPTTGARTSPASAPTREQVTLARKWAYLLSTTAYIPLSHTEIEQRLLELVIRLYRAVLTEPLRTDHVAEVGTRLVALGYTGRASLQCTMEVLGKALLTQPKLRWADRPADRVVALLAVVAAGYHEAAHLVTVEQQRNLDRAMLMSARDAQRNLSASQARFDEVFSHSASGMAISDLDGRVMRANKKFSAIFGYSQDELLHLNLLDLICSGGGAEPGQDRRPERIAQQQRLVAKNGDRVWVSVTVSRMRNGQGEPDEYLALVEDRTEHTLLQQRLEYQAQHDTLTGLPNRPVLLRYLDTALQAAEGSPGLTVYQIGLDGFALVNNSLGRHVGDRLLTLVAQRLQAIFAGERAMVARLDGDEFAVVVENSPGTPDVRTTVARIIDGLGESSHVDDHEVTVTASVGVVHQPWPDTTASELLRTTDVALRRAKSGGSRQWELI